MSERARYEYRVTVDGVAVRHFMTRRAAQHRACEWSTRSGYQDAVIRVERSDPVEFEPDMTIHVVGVYRGGVQL